MLDNLFLVMSIITIVATLVPFIRHDFWIFRVFEYPRLQKWLLNSLLIGFGWWIWPEMPTQKVIMLLLCINWMYLSYLIYPFTVLSKAQIVKQKGPDTGNAVKLFISNVYQDNKNASFYHDLIRKQNPDIILMVETNRWWQEQMDVLGADYPHRVAAPLENTYGMLLYSRMALIDAQVKFLVKEDIPSIDAKLRLPSGQLIQLYCLHPEPPVPQENPRSTERDQEILIVAAKAKKADIPVIVMGDLNDVAWSYTTELFGKTSGLLDPRRGRGFYNSFHAKYFFLRFPLDHVFCSSDFVLCSMKRLPAGGSDHFPMFVHIAHEPRAAVENDAPEADQDDIELANKKIKAT